MDIPVPYSVCTKIQKASNIRENKERHRGIIGKLCKQKGMETLEAQVYPAHIHMCIKILPKYSVSSIIGFLKGKSSLLIHGRHGNLKYKYGNRSFWCRGYYVDTVGCNKKAIS